MDYLDNTDRLPRQMISGVNEEGEDEYERTIPGGTKETHG